MDWNLVIIRNRSDLAKIIAGLFVLCGWVPGGERPTFLRRAVCRELARLLTVSEAALRRLIMIVVIAKKYAVEKSGNIHPNGLPDFASFGSGSGKRAPVFKLFDPRRPIAFVDEDRFYGKCISGPEPRIWTLDGIITPPLVLRQAQDEGGVSTYPANLLRRLEALDKALKNLPRQAKRLTRAMEKRKSEPAGPKRVGVIRPGLPPGYIKHPKHEADHVLRECHGLACDLRGIP